MVWTVVDSGVAGWESGTGGLDWWESDAGGWELGVGGMDRWMGVGYMCAG